MASAVCRDESKIILYNIGIGRSFILHLPGPRSPGPRRILGQCLGSLSSHDCLSFRRGEVRSRARIVSYLSIIARLIIFLLNLFTNRNSPVLQNPPVHNCLFLCTRTEQGFVCGWYPPFYMTLVKMYGGKQLKV